jgi:hypothetical protein
MSDDGRLELDEQGRVLDERADTTVLDLADPDATETFAPNHIQRWVDSTASPYVARHRRGVRATVVVACVTLVGAAWWASRPPYVPPTFDVAIADAVLDGNSIGGPEISPDGTLAVAFVARSRTQGETLQATGIAGPGLGTSTAQGRPVTADVEQRVVLGAQVDCSDPGLVNAVPGSYRLTATGARAGGDPEAGTVPLGLPGKEVTRLDQAITDWCLASLAPTAISVSDIEATTVPGTPLADISVRVVNTSPQPLAVHTERHSGTSIEIDRSPAVVIRPGETATLATRALLHDCATTPALTPLDALRNPHGGATAAGLTLGLALGDRSRVASYAVPGTDALATTLASACRGATGVTATVSDLGSVTVDERGRWALDTVVEARSDGVGITFGREHFSGGESGVDSILTSQTDTVDGGPASAGEWAFGPAQLNGGAGVTLVPLHGGSCSSVATSPPPRLAVRVQMPDRSVHPYEVLLDDARLLRAVAVACAVDLDADAASSLGWRVP